MTDSLRSALFLDFDNVYIGLRRLDPDAAEAFATQPGTWLAALEEGSDLDVERRRRFLVRACYLNPAAFAQFRPNFTRAGFRVVDCPSLTQQGKSSADINLVLDAVDALNAPTHYDEFVIVSADADFTPLVQRFRAADRHVTIVTASPAAAAYRAVADSVVTADDLADMVRPVVAPAPNGDQGALDGSTAADALAATSSAGDAGGAAPSATGSGKGSASGGQGATGGSATGGGSDDGAGGDARRERPRNRAAGRAVRRLVRRADRPVNGSAAAQAAQDADPTLDSGWDGAGGFFAWLAREVPDVAAGSGYVWDPERFSEGDLPGGTDLPPLQRQVVEVTDIPNLTTERYRVLHAAIADDVASHPFDRPATVRRVHEACQAAGEAIGRGSVNAVIAGVLYAGLDLEKGVTAEDVAATWADHVVGLCQGARMELTPQDAAALRSWVGGGLVPTA